MARSSRSPPPVATFMQRMRAVSMSLRRRVQRRAHRMPWLQRLPCRPIPIHRPGRFGLRCPRVRADRRTASSNYSGPMADCFALSPSDLPMRPSCDGMVAMPRDGLYPPA